jgi:putative transposase
MVWFAVYRIVSTLLVLWRLSGSSGREKDLEIVLLRHQLAILERKSDDVCRPSRLDKMILAALTQQLKLITACSIQQLRSTIQIVKPETVIRWHRQLVKHKWTYPAPGGGRPRKDPEIERLVCQLATDNDWGYARIQGELAKLGYSISVQTVANILSRHGIPSLPDRSPSLGWQHLMAHYKQQLMACDFFTVDTLFLHTIYVFFFIEVGTRRVHFAGCTISPNARWVEQQARQMLWKLEDRDPPIRFLIHDRDTKFTLHFDDIFRSESIHVIRTPVRAPNANAFAERWVRSIRHECLDKLIIINADHLARVVREYVQFYNEARPHQGIDQRCPIPPAHSAREGPVVHRTVLGGIVLFFYHNSAIDAATS